MRKLKSKRVMARTKQTKETDADEVPSLMKDRLVARGRRARAAVPFRNKIINASLKQLGLTREALEKRAEADFARAKSESKARLGKLRKLHAAQRKRRGPLRARIEAAFARFGGMESLQ